MERDTILQEEPDRNVLMENEGIVGKNDELMGEANSWNPGVDGDLGQLTAAAYSDYGARKDVSSVHGRYNYHQDLSTPETRIYTKGNQLFVASRGTTIDKDWDTVLTDLMADTGVLGGILSGFDDGGFADRIARDQTVCISTRQDKGRKRGNLKEAVQSFIEWLNSRAAVHSGERIKIECYRNSSRLSSWDQLRGRSIVSLQSPILWGATLQ